MHARMKYRASDCIRQEKTESWKHVDLTKGVYRSVNAIFQKQGGGPEDVQPTINLITKCAKMGHPWLRYNDMTERFDFLDSWLT